MIYDGGKPRRKAWRSSCRQPRAGAVFPTPSTALEAIAQSAKLLRNLRRELGNLGLRQPPTMHPPALVIKADPWGVELFGSSSDATALAHIADCRGSTRPSWAAVSRTSFTMGLRAAAWVGRKSTLGRRTARLPKNCARTCVPLARAIARSNAIERGISIQLLSD